MSLLRRSSKEAERRRVAPGAGPDGAPFKVRVEDVDAPDMISGVLGGRNRAGAESSGPGWVSALDLADLGHDDSIEGLTIDQVSVVRIGDRAVVVPVSPELAIQSGFDVIPASEEALFAIGIRPVPGAPVPVAVRPGMSQVASRWDDPIAEAVREPEVAVAASTDSGTGPDETDDFMAELGPDPSEAHASYDGGDREDPAVPEPTAAVHVGEPDVPGSDFAVPARLEDVPGPDRYEWPVDASSPAWPELERRINDRRDVPVLAWGQVDVPVPVVVHDAGTRPVPPDVIRIATVPDGPRGDVDAEPLVAMVDVALRGSPSRRFGLRVGPGEVVVITGEGGSGKSSLLRVLAGMEAPAAGQVVVDGARLESLSEDERLVRVAVCAGFLSSSGPLVPDLSVVENVELPLLVRGDEPGAARTAAVELLGRWGIGGLAGRGAGTLSTTEQRCVLLARALIGDNRLVLADDPTVGVAGNVASDVIGLLLEQARLGASVVIVTSDPRVLVEGVRLLTMRVGAIVADEWIPHA